MQKKISGDISMHFRMNEDSDYQSKDALPLDRRIRTCEGDWQAQRLFSSTKTPFW
jgi:hypothetical protein